MLKRNYFYNYNVWREKTDNCYQALKRKPNCAGIRKAITAFAEQIKFPSHGLIIRKAKDDFTEIVKGISDL